MRAYFLAFEVHLQDHLPKLKSHFSEQGLTPDLYLTDWYVALMNPTEHDTNAHSKLLQMHGLWNNPKPSFLESNKTVFEFLLFL